MFLQSRLEIHSEDRCEARSEGEPEHAHLDVQAHPDDPVPGLVQLSVDELLRLVDLSQHRQVRNFDFLKTLNSLILSLILCF